MSVAFVLGNGVSRQAIDLQALQKHGSIYGCNALYREFAPDVLVATDRPIAEQIQHSGYAQQHRFHTRKPIAGLGARTIPQRYWGYSSGPAALGIAAEDKNLHIYLLGFDMGPAADGRFNNVYANTEFYKPHAANPTFTGNWIKQMRTVMEDYPRCCFYRVHGATTATITEFETLVNCSKLTIEEFQTRINM